MKIRVKWPVEEPGQLKKRPEWPIEELGQVKNRAN